MRAITRRSVRFRGVLILKLQGHAAQHANCAGLGITYFFRVDKVCVFAIGGARYAYVLLTVRLVILLLEGSLCAAQLAEKVLGGVKVLRGEFILAGDPDVALGIIAQ